MNTWKNILIPTDFSNNAENAIVYAMNLFLGQKAKFILFNAYQVPDSLSMLISVADLVKAEAEKNLANEYKKLQNEFSFKNEHVELVTAQGSLDRVIDDVIKKHKIDMIVMGTKGADNIKTAIMGSNTSKIIKKANCPVLAVPNEANQIAPTNILFAADFSKLNELVILDPLKDIAVRFKSNIDVLYVKPGNKSCSVDQAEMRAKIDNYFGDISHTYFCEQNDYVTEEIEKYIRWRKSTLLVMIPGKNNLFDDVFHRSITNKMANNTEIPLLAIH
jgi:nucleotide-binding universal stress UspA family protein